MSTHTTRRVPAFRYYVPPIEIDRITAQWSDLLRRGAFLSNGPYVEEFEEAFASYAGTDYAVAVSSGTSALEAILRAVDVTGRDVIIPTNTFAATAFAVIHAGGNPVLADIGADLSIDPDQADNLITDTTAAVIAVHAGGIISGGIGRLADICRRRGVALVEDAAQAHGTTLGATHAGAFGTAGAFSFFSTKLMTTGEGGMIVTDDPTIAAAARLTRDQAKARNSNYHEVIGHNWRMTEAQAIMGASQLRTLDDSIAGREHVAALYDAAGWPHVRRLELPDRLRHNRYKYVLFTDNRDEVAVQMKQRGVTPAGFVYDIPLHRQPVFAGLAAGRQFPVADRIADTHLCLPIYTGMTAADIDHVVATVAEVTR